MFLIPAKEVEAGDLVLSKEQVAQRKLVRRVEMTESGHVLFVLDPSLLQHYLPHEEVLVIRRGTRPVQTSEERTDELIRLTKSLLECLEIDRDGDTSTDFLIAMTGAGHELKEKLEEAYCSGDRPCFPSGNREPSE